VLRKVLQNEPLNELQKCLKWPLPYIEINNLDIKTDHFVILTTYLGWFLKIYEENHLFKQKPEIVKNHHFAPYFEDYLVSPLKSRKTTLKSLKFIKIHQNSLKFMKIIENHSKMSSKMGLKSDQNLQNPNIASRKDLTLLSPFWPLGTYLENFWDSYLETIFFSLFWESGFRWFWTILGRYLDKICEYSKITDFTDLHWFSLIYRYFWVNLRDFNGYFGKYG